jgi:hypothetical protein
MSWDDLRPGLPHTQVIMVSVPAVSTGFVDVPAVFATTFERHLRPLLSICVDDLCRRAGHRVFGCCQPPPPALAAGHRMRRRLGVVEAIEHLAHIAQECEVLLCRQRWLAFASSCDRK